MNEACGFCSTSYNKVDNKAVDSKVHCMVCTHTSCGECAVTHVRDAHPDLWMDLTKDMAPEELVLVERIH